MNLDRIQQLIDTGRLDAARPITLQALHAAGIENLQDGVKILARGGRALTSRVHIQATQFSAQARDRIEALGGVAVAVYHTGLGLRALARPQWFMRRHGALPRFAAPVKHRDRLFYSDPEQRGYLVPELWAKCVAADPAFAQRYVHAAPVPVPEPPLTFREFLAQK